jgi:hypothetical protein
MDFSEVQAFVPFRLEAGEGCAEEPLGLSEDRVDKLESLGGVAFA